MNQLVKKGFFVQQMKTTLGPLSDQLMKRIQMPHVALGQSTHPQGQVREISSKPPQKPRIWLNHNAVAIGKTFRKAYVNVAAGLKAPEFQKVGLDAIKRKFKMTCGITYGFDQNKNPRAEMVHTVAVPINDKDGNPTTVDVDHVIHTSIRSKKCYLAISIDSFDKPITLVPVK